MLKTVQSIPGDSGPAFGVYQNVGQALSSNVWTKIQLQVEEFDTNGAFDNVTNYRFQPQTAGYYQLNANIAVAAAGSAVQVGFYKNGSLFKAGGNQPGPTMYANNCSAIIYLNGSTDYIEMYARFSVGQNSEALQTSTWMNGSLVRSA